MHFLEKANIIIMLIKSLKKINWIPKKYRGQSIIDIELSMKEFLLMKCYLKVMIYKQKETY